MKFFSWLPVSLLLISFVAGCDADPSENTATSGSLILYVEDQYVPLFQQLADSFKLRSPNADIQIHSATARAALAQFLDRYRLSATADTAASVAAIFGRRLLPDEEQAIAASEQPIKSFIIGYDGIAFAVASSSPVMETTMERLAAALTAEPGMEPAVDSTHPDQTLQPVMLDPNSSTFHPVAERFWAGKEPPGGIGYVGSIDSLRELVAEGGRLGVLSWYAAHRDSTDLRPLRVGFVDSTGTSRPAAMVHTFTLVTGAYPLKQPLIGYTFDRTNSIAVGFLQWVSKARDAQTFLSEQGLEAENIKYQFVVEDEE